MEQGSGNLKVIVFKACLAAVWTDESMSVEEKRYLSHLTEMLSDTEQERDTFKDLRFQDINEELLLSEIKKLNKDEKIYVYDTCFDILQSDKLLSMQDLKFLGKLRKACDIRLLKYFNKISQAKKYAKVKIITKRKVAIFIAILIAFFMFKPFGKKNRTHVKNISSVENCSEKEIPVTILKFHGIRKVRKKNAQEIFKHVQDSIVYVKVFGGHRPICTGSGFVIGKDETGTNYIITNKHVVDNETTAKRPLKFEIQLHSGAKFDAELDYYSRDHDIAILSVKGMEKYAKPIGLTLKENLEVGQTIYAVGTPIGLKDTFTAGVISALRDDYIQTDATIHSGSSGGPVVDEYGGVCGIVTSGYMLKDYGFAQYSDRILEMLEKRKEPKTEDKDKAEKQKPN